MKNIPRLIAAIVILLTSFLFSCGGDGVNTSRQTDITDSDMDIKFFDMLKQKKLDRRPCITDTDMRPYQYTQ